MEKRQREFHELEHQAIARLEASEDVAVRIWRYPSFEPFDSWLVIKASGAPLLRRIRWDRPRDQRRLCTDPLLGLRLGFHTRPTLSREELELDWHEPERLLESLHGIQLPAAVGGGITIDGVRSGLEIPGRIRIEWNHSEEALAPLVAWHAATITRFEASGLRSRRA